ncbi:MAG TPA: hypothetical protein VLA89_16535, partial [Gemmatimonadales bacterium]|nr:hypothetical protein [Gemmatimonadales bacterium]
ILARETGMSVSNVGIELVKNIPAAGGLGGGSSDAATVVRLLWKVWPEITPSIAARACEAVGSDVAALANGGTVFAYGRGEIVFRQPDLPTHGVVLFVPSATMERKTARMFAALDSLPFDDGSITEALKGRLPCPLRGHDIFNAFERVAFDMFPGLATLWEELETRVGEPIHLAGAGPTLFWIGPLRESDAVAARAEGLACTVIPTRTSPSLWRR